MKKPEASDVQVPMSKRRYYDIERGAAELSQTEILDGWHFCDDWDGMLIHPKSPEGEACTCPRHTTH